MIKFAFELLDRMSGPAAKIAGQLSRVDKALASNAAATEKLEGKTDKASLKTLKSLEKQAGALNKQKEKLLTGQVAVAGKTAAEAKLALKTKDAGDKTKAAADKAGKQSVALKGMGDAASATAAKLMALAAAVGLGAAGARMLLDAQKYKDTISSALTITMGSQTAAKGAMAEVQRIADVIGISTEETMGRFRELQSSGFSERESKILMQFAADLKVASGGQEVAISKIAEPLQALKRNEVLTSKSFDAFLGASISQNRINEVLAKQLGVKITNHEDTNKTQRDVDRALAQRNLRGQKAVDFWSKVNLDVLGEQKLGEQAKKFQDTTVTGALDKVKNRWDSLVKSINGGPLGERLVAVLNRISEALNPDGGGKGIIETMDKLVGMASKVYDGVKPLMDAFGAGFGDGFGKALGDVMEFVNLIGIGSSSSADFASGLKWVGESLGELAVGTIAVIGGLAWLTATIVEALVTLPANAKAIGTQVINGLVDGFEMMKGRLVSAVTGIKDTVVGKLRSMLQIQSPSKVMRQLGSFTAEGFAQGVDGGAPDVASAARSGMVDPVIRATVQAPGGGRGGATIAAGAIQIVVQGGSDAEAIAREVEARLRSLLLGMGLET